MVAASFEELAFLRFSSFQERLEQYGESAARATKRSENKVHCCSVLYSN